MLELANISKEYPGTTALDDVSVRFNNASIHALLGKNGAGKSTLVKIIAGATEPTSGQIILNQKNVTLRSPADAFRKGIATVYQELSLFPELTVGENIFIGRQPARKLFGVPLIEWQDLYREARNVLDELSVDIDVKKKVSELGIAQQQVVELAKAMSFHPSVLLLDEPTSALPYHEVEILFGILKNLRAKGISIVYITHRLHEVHEIADTITVLRDGKHIGTLKATECTPAGIVNMMFGEIPLRGTPTGLPDGADTVLTVRNLEKKDKFSGINMTVRKGEVVGIAGMLGSGRTELLRAIYGADRFDAGEIVLNGKKFGSITPRVSRASGMAFVSENRKEEGLIQILNTRINLCLASYNRIGKRGFITSGKEALVVEKYIKELQIRLADSGQIVTSLSGGNQQKVIIGKWLNIEPLLFLLDEPTRGIDIQTKVQIFQIIRKMSMKGISSILVSTELEELLEVCHRILIMKNGKIVKEVSPDITAEDLFVLCMEN